MSNKRQRHIIHPFYVSKLKRLFAPREITGGGQPGRGKPDRRIIASNKNGNIVLHATKGYRVYRD